MLLKKGFNEQHILDKRKEIIGKAAPENDCVDKYYDLLIQRFVHGSNLDTADKITMFLSNQT